MRKTKVKGYKVFESDWTCRPGGHVKQYACPGRFKQNGKLDLCENGMHFCKKLIDCFKYYKFNPRHKVAEVIAHGEVLTKGNKSCTNDLEIVRELSWYEVLNLINVGKGCTGYGNVGNFNFGCFNIGDLNSGYNNLGRKNTGKYNFGHGNTGCKNYGWFNTGSCNQGDCNIGTFNSGNYNIGDFNGSNHNTGCFNTKDSEILLFNKPSGMTFYQWRMSEPWFILSDMPASIEWIPLSKMTEEEKEEYPNHKITYGFLTIIDVHTKRQKWWDDLPKEEKNIIKAIPNFDAEIFFQCTGIRVKEGDEENEPMYILHN